MNPTRGMKAITLFAALALIPAGCGEESASSKESKPAATPTSPTPAEKPAEVAAQPTAAEPVASAKKPAPADAVHSALPPVSGAPPRDAIHAGLPAPTGKPPADAVHGALPIPGGDGKLMLTGLTLEVPEGWQAQPIKSAMVEAAFVLPKAEGDAADAAVRVSHFPNMRGMNDRNIERWVSQVNHPDGRAMTREDVSVETIDLGTVKLTLVDLSGTVKPMSDGSGPAVADHRMIAVIIDHPKGPHFVKITGSLATMKKWEDAVHTFLRSAKVTQP